MKKRVCCICGACTNHNKKKDSRSFFAFPNKASGNLRPSDINFVERRIAAWMKVVGSNYNKCYGVQCVCSDHFHSGHPCHLRLENNVDWVPSLNLEKLVGDGQHDCNFDAVNPAESSSITSSDIQMDIDKSLVQKSTNTNNGYCLVNSSTSVTNDDPRLIDATNGSIDPSDIRTLASNSTNDGDVTSSSDECIDNIPQANVDKSISTTAKKCYRTEISSLIDELKIVGISKPEEWKLLDLLKHFESDLTQRHSSGSLEQQLGESSAAVGLPEQLNAATKQCANGLNSIEEQLQKMTEESNQLKKSITDLQESLAKEKMINRIRENDKMTKFYTGLNSWKLLLIIYKLVLPGIEHCSTSHTRKRFTPLPTLEQFLLVLMRLRLNLSLQDLSFRFHISQGTASKYIAKWIDVMYVRLARNFMIWPSKEALAMSTPTYFRNKFPGCVSIIDCFEIPIERFNNLVAPSSTYSFYKGRNTIKYLISVTPRGSISYISQGYEGRATDVNITLDRKNLVVVNDEKYFDLIKEGDVVLAERGWLGPSLEQELRKRRAHLVTPTFLDRRHRLTLRETIFSRKVSNIRIHVERVVGKLRRTYKILTGRVPVNLLRKDENNISFFDKIVFVCCCLNNANPSVVPAS